MKDRYSDRYIEGSWVQARENPPADPGTKSRVVQRRCPWSNLLQVPGKERDTEADRIEGAAGMYTVEFGWFYGTRCTEMLPPLAGQCGNAGQLIAWRSNFDSSDSLGLSRS
jgi:hypothetical protein